jgi:hypothetical protein
VSTETATALIAGLALVISLTTALWSRRALVTTTYRSATDLALEIDRLFVERPYLRPFFYEKRKPCPERAEEVKAAAELVLDVLECIWDNRPLFAPRDEESWREWIHEVFEYSWVVQELYEESPHWYPTLQDLLEWEPCSPKFRDSHRYAASKPGPKGEGLMFTFRRRTRNAPLLGRLAGRPRSRAGASSEPSGQR